METNNMSLFLIGSVIGSVLGIGVHAAYRFVMGRRTRQRVTASAAEAAKDEESKVSADAMSMILDDDEDEIEDQF